LIFSVIRDFRITENEKSIKIQTAMAKMTGKELIKELCENLQEQLKLTSQTRNTNPDSVEFISTQILNEWIVEIRVNNKVIFRESSLIQTGQSLQIIEEMLINIMLKSVFCYGVMASKKDLVKFFADAL
jgi:hypothetical protein